MHNPHDPQVLPMREGVNPSCVVLPSQGGGTMLDFLTQRLPAVSRADWCGRMAAGEVVDEYGQAVDAQRPFVPGIRLYYYRALPPEAEIPFQETVLYHDEHLLVADKPHFLPVVPTGAYLQNTLLVRLKRRWGLRDLSPLHRIDRDTAGLVLFSTQRATRGRYQALFRTREMAKVYEAIAPYDPRLTLPCTRSTRLEEGAEFFRMREVQGEANTHTHIALIERLGDWAHYRLEPLTGKRHQLRVHMCALGLPLRGDGLYPHIHDSEPGDYSAPLQLLARSLSFTDPLSGERRHFESRLQLQHARACMRET